ncbi:MAG: GTP-binding protein [Planctomycetota bacterium]|nr:MAG: GTP-binding protein [Planctomycetota bacterium]REJ91927.1 MAG: GTP-binding protein [Planctomycetota bacterium]REK27347.1 MAG: GTP-binding protein [Planctomycetota bacterium]REK36631.1 MAG: GTP-binding protein [Planctomycetota bacterium]
MEALLHETIAAAASATGSGLRAVIRVSGPETKALLDDAFEPDRPEEWRACRSALRHSGSIRLPETPTPLPVHVLLWPNARSYTGQPAAEVHMVGSPPLVEAVLERLYLAGARPAQAGEFTLRAFLAGRIDLLQAEAVLGVIDAPDDAWLRTALAQLAGGVSGKLAEIHEQLLIDLADLEAGLDFVDEDIDFVSRTEFAARLAAAADFLARLLEQASGRWHAHAAPSVVIAGLPNAGKSTLFNLLIEDHAAIVTEYAGTTRDYLRAPCKVGRLAIELVDTAGREPIRNELHQAAQGASENALLSADLILWCTPSDASQSSRAEDERFFAMLREKRANCLRVATKADLAQDPDQSSFIAVSARNGTGIDALRTAIADRLLAAPAAGQELLGSTAARCRDSLRKALEAVERARALASQGAGDELIALEIREALEQTGRIAGRVYTDDLLDRIFSRFCIGK